MNTVQSRRTETPDANPVGFGSPADYHTTDRPARHRVDRCPWCGDCLHCFGADECLRGTDGLHYWPPRSSP